MNRVAILAIAFAFASPSTCIGAVDGLSDDNLPLLTNAGQTALQTTEIRHARMVVSYGTPGNDSQIGEWMNKVRRLGWSSTIAVRLPAGHKVPTVQAYMTWLRAMVYYYPQVSAVEATNEPDITNIPVGRAVQFYKAARDGLGVQVLAGGFSDRKGSKYYVHAYTRRLHAPSKALWAFHFYKSIINPRTSLINWTIKKTHAKKIYITETAAFAALGKQRFTPAQQTGQARRVLALSNRSGVLRTYWQGGESCHGCRPRVSRKGGAGSITVAAPSEYRIPYKQAVSPIIWDSYLLSTMGDRTIIRPSMDIAF